MEYFTQFVRILGVTLAGEILHLVLPLPIPASVYGLALMLAALLTGVLKLEQVEGAAGFLVQVMPVTFIPAVGGSWGSLTGPRASSWPWCSSPCSAFSPSWASPAG